MTPPLIIRIYNNQKSNLAGGVRCHMDQKTALNASIGALVLLTATSLPGTSLLAGGIAGYLEANVPRTGARVGIVAGGIALAALHLPRFILRLNEAINNDIVHYLWVGLGHPVINGVFPYLVLPLLGGAIGAYIRAETSTNKASQ